MPAFAGQLSEVALSLINAGALEATLAALRSGELRPATGLATIDRVAGGRRGVDRALQALLRLWQDSLQATSGVQLACTLEAIGEAVAAERRLRPAPELVWSGPQVEGSFLRSTAQLMEELLRSASEELLFVGYWLAAGDASGELVRGLVEALGAAAARGVRVQLVLDAGKKRYGDDNRDALLSLWPAGCPAPELWTWRSERNVKLHAKVLVVDRADALVTSANLTRSALEENMELGVRVGGAAARKIAEHFERLRVRGVLVPYG